MENKKHKWTFAESSPNERGDGGESLSLKLFRERPNRSLIREFTQNSIDARSKKPGAPIVEVQISYIELDDDIRKSMVEDLQPRVEACIEATSKNSNSKNPFTSKLTFICEKGLFPVSCMKIADFNTTGMMYFDESKIYTIEEYRKYKRPPFNACVRMNGASDKTDSGAGGSHGQGKNAGLERSPLNAMYYSTMTEETVTETGLTIPELTFGEGIVSLCNHVMFDENGVHMYKKDGFFDCHGGLAPDQDTEIPKCFRRTAPGTDAYIIGLAENENDKREIIEYMLRSFFPAIMMEKVVFKLFGIDFNKGNLAQRIEEYFPQKKYSDFDTTGWYYKFLFNPRPYCLEALMKKDADSNHIVEVADPKVYTHLDDTKFFMWKDESIRGKSKDIILYMRDNGMVVDVRREKFGKGFYGLVICAGKSSEYLRLMENVTHDAWDKQQLCDVDEEKRIFAEAVVNEIEQFVNDTVNKIFPRVEGAESNIPGLNEVMSVTGAKPSDGTGSYSTGESDKKDFDIFTLSTVGSEIRKKWFGGSKAGEITVRKPGGISKKKKDEASGQKPPKDVKPLPKDDDKKEEEQKDQDNKDNKNKSNRSGNHDNSGNQLNLGGVEEGSKGKHTVLIPASFMQKSIHGENGVTHRVRIESLKDYEECSMVINAADMTNGSPLEVKSISRVVPEGASPEQFHDSFVIEGAEHNTIRGFNLSAGYNTFDIIFGDAFDHSLLITAYEIK